MPLKRTVIPLHTLPGAHADATDRGQIAYNEPASAARTGLTGHCLGGAVHKLGAKSQRFEQQANGAPMDLNRLAKQAKRIVDKRGGVESLKEDANELRNIAGQPGSLRDKAKAAAAALKDPGATGDAPEAGGPPQPAAPAAPVAPVEPAAPAAPAAPADPAGSAAGADAGDQPS